MCALFLLRTRMMPFANLSSTVSLFETSENQDIFLCETTHSPFWRFREYSTPLVNLFRKTDSRSRLFHPNTKPKTFLLDLLKRLSKYDIMNHHLFSEKKKNGCWQQHAGFPRQEPLVRKANKRFRLWRNGTARIENSRRATVGKLSPKVTDEGAQRQFPPPHR